MLVHTFIVIPKNRKVGYNISRWIQRNKNHLMLPGPLTLVQVWVSNKVVLYLCYSCTQLGTQYSLEANYAKRELTKHN